MAIITERLPSAAVKQRSAIADELLMKVPRPPRLSTVLSAFATVLALSTAGGWLVAMAHYHDDRPDQVWQFDLGMDLALYGFLLTLIVGAAAVWARLFGR